MDFLLIDYIIYGLQLFMDFQFMDFQFIDYIVYGLQLLMDFQFMDFQFIDYIVYRLQLLMDFQFMDFQLIEFQFMEYCWRNSFLDIVHVDSINCIGLSRLRIDWVLYSESNPVQHCKVHF